MNENQKAKEPTLESLTVELFEKDSAQSYANYLLEFWQGWLTTELSNDEEFRSAALYSYLELKEYFEGAEKLQNQKEKKTA